MALWGLRLRLDPDYPYVFRFFPELISDVVLEYRTYALTALWGIVLVWALPESFLWLLIVLWAFLAFWRAGFYASPFRFWMRAWTESPAKIRTQTRLFEQLCLEIERLHKAPDCGEEQCQNYSRLARQIMDNLTAQQEEGRQAQARQ